MTVEGGDARQSTGEHLPGLSRIPATIPVSQRSRRSLDRRQRARVRGRELGGIHELLKRGVGERSPVWWTIVIDTPLDPIRIGGRSREFPERALIMLRWPNVVAGSPTKPFPGQYGNIGILRPLSRWIRHEPYHYAGTGILPPQRGSSARAPPPRHRRASCAVWPVRSVERHTRPARACIAECGIQRETTGPSFAGLCA